MPFPIRSAKTDEAVVATQSNFKNVALEETIISGLLADNMRQRSATVIARDLMPANQLQRMMNFTRPFSRGYVPAGLFRENRTDCPPDKHRRIRR